MQGYLNVISNTAVHIVEELGYTETVKYMLDSVYQQLVCTSYIQYTK